jgi:hypothetical protein
VAGHACQCIRPHLDGASLLPPAELALLLIQTLPPLLHAPAQAMEFFINPNCTFVTGQTLCVDGGLSMMTPSALAAGA